MKVIIAGSREFHDYATLKAVCDHMLQNSCNIVVLSGGANGADKLGEKYANEKGHLLNIYPAQWEKFGKSAGYRRNEQMADHADALIAFWDGKSRGTMHMINIAKKKKLKIKVHRYGIGVN